MRPRFSLSLFFAVALIAAPRSAPGEAEGPIAEKPPAARKVQGHARQRVREKLDRGLVARPAGEGKVYVGWRLLDSDPPGAAFNVYRRAAGGEAVRLSQTPVARTTDFTAPAPDKPGQWLYFVRPVMDGKEGEPSREVRGPGADDDRPCLTVQLDTKETFQKAGIADLDGDGRLDYVIKQPADNIDPYEQYWKPSPDTYKLAAYGHDGNILWRFDLGWAIERGIWYSPYVVYDFDGDGQAEVAVKTGEGDPRDPDGRVTKGPEYLTILDGATGQPVARVAWPSREGFGEGLRGYNYASRNQLGVAYLDGKTPCLIVGRGTYNLMKVVAYELCDGRLRELWRWDNSQSPRTWQGQGAHWMHSADIDADGRDEVLLGSCVLDDDGTPLWTTGLGHPDHFYVGDIDPARSGLEIYYGIEARQKERNGMCLVEAATGKILWGHEGPTRHVHGQGLCSDIDPRHPGWECYSADTDAKKAFAFARLRSGKGEIISEEDLGGFGARCAYWDADLQRELVLGKRIVKYRGRELAQRIEGSLVAVADVLGDWREEIITSVPGEMRIYTTTVPAADRRPCLLSDPIYRIDVVHAAMGYYQAPMLGRDPADAKK